MSPRRIQRKRMKGWRMPAGAVYVGRPTRWGNIFWTNTNPSWPNDCAVRLSPYNSRGYVESREAAVELYRWWLRHTPEGRRLAAEAAKELRGKDLACWCPAGEPCHADALIEIANEGTGR